MMTGEILNHRNLLAQLIILFLQKIISLKVIMGMLRDISPDDIMGVLRAFGFQEYGAAYNRLPCVIVAI